MSVRLAARTQTPRTQPPAASLGRQWPTIALARAVRHVRCAQSRECPLSTPPTSPLLRRIAAYCGLLWAHCLLQYAPGSRRLRRARRRRRWRGHAGCSGPAPSAQPREIIIIIIINKDKNSSSSSSSNNNNNERSAVTAVRFIPGGDLKSWICRPRAGPRPQRSSGRVPPARRRLQAPLIAAYCGLLCLVAACCGPAPAPGSPTPPPPPSPAWRSFRPLYPAHCSLLQRVAAVC